MPPGHVADISERFDPLDPAQDDMRYELWAEARAREPVFYSPKYEVWFVTRYKDIEAVLRNATSYSKCDDFAPALPWPDEVHAALAKGYSWDYFLSNNDPPIHTPLKRVVSKAMSRRQTQAMSDRVREIASELIDTFADEGIAELGEQLAWPFPALVTLELIGFPRHDMEQLKQWGDEWVLLFSDAPLETSVMVGAADQFVSFQKYVLDHLRERERNPRDDLLSHLIRELHNDPEINLGLEDIVNIPIAVMTAGHVTGTLLLLEEINQLLRHPGLMDDILANPAKIPLLVEEALRFEPPVHGTFIRAIEDVEIGGVPIPADSRILLSYGSANHDPEAFQCPEAFDIERPDVDRHLGFGKGMHYCPGAPLARLEQRFALEILLERCPNLRLAEDRPAERMQHFWLRGYQSLWVQWDAQGGKARAGG